MWSGMFLAPIGLPHCIMYLVTIRLTFGYLAPITASGNCFLVNDVMNWEAVHKE